MMPHTSAADGSVASSAAVTDSAEPVADRRVESRAPAACELWMVGHNGGVILRCTCDNASEHGMHLAVPLGYGIARGQRYELRSHFPGTTPLAGFDFTRSRWATVVHTELLFGEREDRLSVGVLLDR